MNQAPSSLDTLISPAETAEEYVHDIQALLEEVAASPLAVRQLDRTVSKDGKTVSLESTTVDVVAADGKKYAVQSAHLNDGEVILTVSAYNVGEHDTLKGATWLEYSLVRDSNLLFENTSGLKDGQPLTVSEQITDIEKIKEITNKLVGLQAVSDVYAASVA